MLEGEAASFASDLWALGVMLYQFATGTRPFTAGTEYLTFQRITAVEYSLPEGFPPVLGSLVRALLVRTPSNRLGADNLLDLRAHRYFEGVDWAAVEDMPPPDVSPYLLTSRDGPDALDSLAPLSE